QWCTCEHCGVDLRDGFCPLCNSSNSCVYDPNPNSFDYSPDSYNPPNPTYETYLGDSCGNDPQFGYECPPQFPLNYEPEPSYIQDYNSYPHDSSSSSQQYLCCDNCGGLHETFQCQPTNQNFYNSNSSGSDQSQTLQFPVIHPPPQEMSIEILHDHENVLLLAWDRVSEIKDAPEDIQELLRKLFNDVQNIHEELAEYINTLSWNCLAFYNNDEDDDEDYTIAITPDFSITDSLIMRDEHLDTILENKSYKFIKSSFENLVPNPSESEDLSDIEMTTNHFLMRTFRRKFIRTLFYEEIISIKIDPHLFNDESDLTESLLNQGSSIISYPKFDSLLEEFSGELAHIDIISPGINEVDFDPEEEIRLYERLLYDNSSPRPLEEFYSKNSDVIIKSFSPSPIPVEDSDPFIEEIDLFLASD
nr:hypothetical protein [Tanacetum cinerariifolium]